jgi:two-component system NtrC family sensor kinase
MRIAVRVNVALLTILACGAVATYAALHMTIRPKFDEIERSDAIRNHERVVDAINAATEKLATATQDYSFWDETYQFIRGDDVERYIKSNLQPELAAIQNLGVNALVFQNDDGSVKWGAAFDIKTAEPIEGLVEEVAEFSKGHETANPGGFAERGLFKTSRGIVLAAIAPILKSDRSGTAFGKVISVKLLKVEDIKSLTGVDFDISDDLSTLPAKPISQDVSQDVTVAVQPKEIVTKSTIKSLINEPLAVITARSDRHVSEAGASAIRYALLMMISGAVIATGLLWLFLQNTIVSRVQKLSAHLSTAGATGSIREVAIDDEDDEFQTLIKSFNAMAQQVNQLQNALADNAYRAGLSEWASGTLHNVRNGLAPLTASTWQIKQLYSQAWLNNVRSAIEQYDDQSTPEARRSKLQSFLIGSVARLVDNSRHVTELAATMDQATQSVVDIVSEFDRYATRNTELANTDALPIITAAASSCSTTNANVEFVLPAVSLDLQTNGVILNQVLINVFLNAIEAMTGVHHRPKIEVSFIKTAHRGHIVVKDNGEGLTTTMVANAFQIGASSRNKNKRGLGLHWCANAVKVLHGEIRIFSEGPGRGAEVHIELPLFKSELQEAA